ncbi:MAG: glycosyltransferase family 4 protein [Ignavibacteria bacterium]|nr:glycosyltransferase family 4 protein [Ignavibacteria bacterium]
MRVLQISECFPTKYKPQTGEFILKHVSALSKLCEVKLIAPLRFIPPREALLAGYSGVRKWLSQINETEGMSDGQLSVEYMNYISLPRPIFEAIDEKLINTLFRKKLFDLIKAFSPDILYCHWLRPWAGIAASISKELGIPFVIDHHEDLPTMKILFPNDYSNFLNTFLLADMIILHSNENRTDLQNEIASLNNIELIYLGQSFEIFENDKEFSNDNIKLICVSHLHEPRKNIDVLLKALALLSDKLKFSMRIIGDGPLKSDYEKLCLTLNLSGVVTFEGSLPQDKIKQLLDDSDMFILPSFPEAFGIVFAEALARGVPVVTCKGNGGGEELRLLGYPSVLAEPLSADDLSKKILALANNIEAKNEMSYKGRKIARENFTWERNALQTFDMMTELLNQFHNRGNVRN